MYKDGDPTNFELFTGARTREAILGFVQAQMDLYKKSHVVASADAAAKFVVKHGALSAGSDLYRARLDAAAAQTYCGANAKCAGFTWQPAPAAGAPPKPGAVSKPEEPPLVYFKGGISVEAAHASMNNDQAWTSYIKLANATTADSSRGSLAHGPEGCRIAGHLNVRKVPGTLRLGLRSTEHDHEHDLINSSHVVHELWFGETRPGREPRTLPAHPRPRPTPTLTLQPLNRPAAQASPLRGSSARACPPPTKPSCSRRRRTGASPPARMHASLALHPLRRLPRPRRLDGTPFV